MQSVKANVLHITSLLRNEAIFSQLIIIDIRGNWQPYTTVGTFASALIALYAN